jgi:hypothetical protein
MASPEDNRKLLIGGGAVLAVVAAVGLGFMFTGGGDEAPEAPPAAMGGLTVAVADAPGLEPNQSLRCFVDGRFVGEATLADCAQQNGVATDALDVGLDETGALAAAPTASFIPVPEEPEIDLADMDAIPMPDDGYEEASAPPRQDYAQAPSGQACLRHVGNGWRQLSSNMGLSGCVQALYSGVCVAPGEAQYGRWGATTLRLVPRRVEQSDDNSRFRVLTRQNGDCQFPELG